jgi:hypothetical protein
VPVFDHLRGHDNILFGMGYNGTGIAQTPIGGSILASLALERDDRWSNSGLVGLSRRSIVPPEPFRYLGAKVIGAAVRRKNDAEIRNEIPSAPIRALIRLMPGATEH